jgi:hypothetical protein
MKVISAAAALVVAALGFSGSARADGCIVGKNGVYLPVEEQRAFIEWRDGQERLFLATRAGAGGAPSVWIIPVPARPDQVHAEPAETLPRVVALRSVAETARSRLTEVRDWSLILDSGVLVVIGLLAPGAQPAPPPLDQPPPEAAQVHGRLERLGLVLELVTAESPAALERYLSARQLGAHAMELRALDPYFGQPYTFVCAWSATESGRPAARAVRIDFPSPTLFYPLQPARVYGADLETVIYVRGFVRAQAEPAVPGLRCRFVRGKVVEAPAEETFGDRTALPGFGPPDDEPLTRIELVSEPADWSADLTLVRGAPTAIRAAEGVRAIGPWLMFLLTATVGVVVASFLPLAVMPAKRRGWEDWVWAWLVGAASCLSILAAAMVFYAWCCDRKPAGRLAPLGTFARAVLWAAGLSLGVLAVAVALREMTVWGAQAYGLSMLMLAAVVLFAVALPLAIVCLVYSAAQEQLIWLLLFTVLHLGVLVGLCEGLSLWLAKYV